MPAQVLKECKGFLPASVDADQIEGLDDEQAAELEQAKEAKNSCIRRFLGLEPGSLVSMPKVYRQATHHWPQAIDCAPFHLTGLGWEAFVSRGTKVTLLPAAYSDSLRERARNEFCSSSISSSSSNSNASFVTRQCSAAFDAIGASGMTKTLGNEHLLLSAFSSLRGPLAILFFRVVLTCLVLVLFALPLKAFPPTLLNDESLS